MNYTWISNIASQDEQFRWLEQVRELDQKTHARPPDGAGPYPISFFRQSLIEEMAKIIIAHRNQELIGYGILSGTLKSDVLLLTRVYVRSGYRKKGIGRKLLKRRVEFADQHEKFLRATTGLANHGSLKNMLNYYNFIGFQTIPNMYQTNSPILLLGRPPSGFGSYPTTALSNRKELIAALQSRRVLKGAKTRDGDLTYEITEDTFRLDHWPFSRKQY